MTNEKTQAPAVVVVDRCWQCFEQFAAVLLREGVRVVYVGMELYPADVRLRRALFPETHFLRSFDGLAEVLAGLGDVADVQCIDEDLPHVLAAARTAGLPDAVLTTLAAREPYGEKVTAARALAAADLPVPRTMPGDADPAEVVAALGQRVVVKGVRGSGGWAVDFATGAQEVGRAVAAMAAKTGDTVFCEELVPGRNLNYAAVHAHGVVVEEALFASVRSHDDVRLPGTAVEVVHDERALRIGREVARSLPGIGFVDVEVMACPERVAVIDTNMRPFGSMMALRGAGVDLAGAYLQALTGRRPRRPRAHRDVVEVFPVASERMLDVDLPAAVRDFVTTLPRACHEIAPRYAALASVMFGRELRGRAARRVRAARTARAARAHRAGGPGSAAAA